MTRIASHRGGTLEFGDSTPAGFEATARMALEEVEFDLHPTADGAIMVHHDATLERTTDRSGAICDLREAEVRSATIDYGAGSHPLSLQELCAIYRRSAVGFRCEIKPGPDRRPYADF
ncbi:MAG: glycerophosphodiester phosphodiesterase family protein, partial [Pseudomonadota bacterium]|nr:glycerophosphodiester phosphodiesterase family protein [Pseudomonadota bacterium]